MTKNEAIRAVAEAMLAYNREGNGTLARNLTAQLHNWDDEAIQEFATALNYKAPRGFEAWGEFAAYLSTDERFDGGQPALKEAYAKAWKAAERADAADPRTRAIPLIVDAMGAADKASGQGYRHRWTAAEIEDLIKWSRLGPFRLDNLMFKKIMLARDAYYDALGWPTPGT